MPVQRGPYRDVDPSGPGEGRANSVLNTYLDITFKNVRFLLKMYQSPLIQEEQCGICSLPSLALVQVPLINPTTNKVALA